jgi:hypothetical protein
MATVPLIPAQIETTLQAITLSMLGIDPGFDASAYGEVRIGWQQEGQPAQSIDEDVVYLRAISVDDPYNRVRDVSYPDPLTELTQYTRVWEAFWECLGPNSFDHVRQIRSALFTQAAHDQFTQANLYLVTDVEEPRRVPEQKDGQWWQRSDLSARFNEFVTESRTSQSVLSSEVILSAADVATPILDVTVEG